MVEDIRTRRQASRQAAARYSNSTEQQPRGNLAPLPPTLLAPAAASRERDGPFGVSGFMWRRDPVGAFPGLVQGLGLRV